MAGGIPARGRAYGHLSWHLALSELQRGNLDEGYRLFDAAFATAAYGGPAFLRLVDGAAFLWRAELAGAPRDAERWRAQMDLAEATLLRAYLAAGRVEDAERLRTTRRAGPAPLPVAS